ncbi:unnamed protein product, partial [Meganyctiphanes norvegica]
GMAQISLSSLLLLVASVVFTCVILNSWFTTEYQNEVTEVHLKSLEDKLKEAPTSYCFHHDKIMRNQSSGVALCADLSATLPYPTGSLPNWQKAVRKFIAGRAPWYWAGATLHTDGRWLWPDGTVVQDSAWATGEPSGDGPCSHFVSGKGILYDGPCTESRFTICEGNLKSDETDSCSEFFDLQEEDVPLKEGL